MTWSIVARDGASGAFGVAVTTKAFACGARCPHASGVGALSTQSFTNPSFGPRGLRLLAEGVPAAAVVAILTQADEGRAIRQLHIVDAAGGTAAWTGDTCIDWAGHQTGEGFSVAGNMLAGPAVVAATAAAFSAGSALPFAERLIGALDAGQAAGGDKRGRQSAALLIHSGDVVADLDLRVDDAAAPLVELRRLLEMFNRDTKPFRFVFPSRERPSGIHDPREIEAIYAKAGRSIGFPR